ncbi:MAG: recombinase family protein [Anaerovoracaceae bacterium]
MARTSRKKQADVENAAINVWRVALYVRLSMEDNGAIGGDSVGNQLELVRDFVIQMQNVSETYIYIDNGATGTNFKRLNWEQLVKDVKCRKINCVVVKDLSRFARNYIEAGDYLEKIFPFWGVRFIAINDCYDSSNLLFKENALTVSLKNLINDYYSKDISKKIMSTFKAKKENGEFIGSMAPYGYQLKDNHFIIDQEAAKVVKRMFLLFSQGVSGYAIAKLLNEERVSCPSKYACEKGLRKYRGFENALWQSQAVARILYNETYTGKLIWEKTNNSRYSSKANGSCPREEWRFTPNSHEAIIDEDIFQIVQQRRIFNQKAWENRRNRKIKNKKENLLKGYLFCGVCGHPLRRGSTARNGKAEYSYYCNTSYSHADAGCTTAFISESKIFNAILTYIKIQVKVAVEMNRVLQRLEQSMTTSKQYRYLCSSIERNQAEYNRISVLKDSIYEDFKYQLLTRDEYLFAKERYSKQMCELRKKVEEDKKHKELYEENLNNRKNWVCSFRRFADANEITREMMEVLIERIELFPDRRIQLTFRFLDEYNSFLPYIDGDAVQKGESRDAEIHCRIS